MRHNEKKNLHIYIIYNVCICVLFFWWHLVSTVYLYPDLEIGLGKVECCSYQYTKSLSLSLHNINDVFWEEQREIQLGVSLAAKVDSQDWVHLLVRHGAEYSCLPAVTLFIQRCRPPRWVIIPTPGCPTPQIVIPLIIMCGAHLSKWPTKLSATSKMNWRQR